MSDRTSRIEAAFNAALESTRDARPRVVAAHTGNDPDLEAEALELLAAHDASGEFDRIAAELGVSLAEHDGPAMIDSVVGSRIGPYERGRLLGHGGMGSVYLAERADGQFSQRVAIKVQRTDLALPDPHGRLVVERQILARLSHANIARLLDGGVSETGSPYFVMEYVEGEPIDRYCDRQRLSVRDRLRLFITVCDAVQYAHRALVIHRDIKPSNILVTPDGTVKLLDFGIAKLMDAEVVEGAATTLPALRALTPEYASPEQVLGQPVTTASDVYQLGLVLYELVAGRRAHRLTGRSLAEVERAVVSGVQRRPSQAATDPADDQTGDAPLSNTPTQIASDRGTTPDRLRRQLAQGIDSIVLMAGRPEPDRRYGSPGELAADIQRHLDGRPVRATPATVWYRTHCFVRRHTIAVASAAVIVGLTIAYAAGLARETRRTVAERARAEEVTRFLSDLFSSSDPAVARGDTLTVREVLDRGAARIRGEQTGDAELRARLLAVIAKAYTSLDLLDQAAGLREEVLAIRRRSKTPNDTALMQALLELAAVRMRRGDLARASPLLEEAETVLRGSAISEMGRADALTAIGFTWQNVGALDRAEPLLEQALRRYRSVSPPADRAAALSNLGMLRLAKGDADSAAKLLREGLAIRRGALDANDPVLAVSLENLATVLASRGDLAAADSALREALRITRPVYPPGHSRVVGLLATRAAVLRRRGERAEAERSYREALDLTVRRNGEHYPFVAQLENDLGTLLKESGRLEEAEDLYRRALAGYRANYGATHDATAIVQTNLAWLVSMRGRAREADSLYAAAVPHLRRARPRTASTGTILVDFGLVRGNTGDARGAAALLREGLSVLQPTLGETHDQTLRARNMLGLSLSKLGQFDEAEALLLESLRIARARPAGDPAVFWAASSLAQLYEAWGRADDAKRYRAMTQALKRGS